MGADTLREAHLVAVAAARGVAGARPGPGSSATKRKPARAARRDVYARAAGGALAVGGLTEGPVGDDAPAISGPTV